MKMQPFNAFVSLIEFDQSIRTLSQDIQNTKIQIEDLLAQRNQLLESIDAAGNHVHDLRKQVDEQELEMKTLDEQEKQKRKKLETISDQRAYESAQKEIDHLKAAQHEGEQVLLELWNKLESAQSLLETKKAEQSQSLQKSDTAIKEEKNSLTQLQEKIAQLETQRPVDNVPEEWLERYESMRSSVDNPVVPVEAESCSACSGTITNQDMVRLKRKALLTCKTCFRLLYSKEAMGQEVENTDQTES